MSDEQAIRAAIANWLTATEDGDVQALADILADDMLFVVRDRPPFGKKEFLAGGMGKPYEFNSKLEVCEVIVNGDWALTRVQLAIGITPAKGAKAMRLEGPTMTVWRKAASGNWQIWRDANFVTPVA